MMTATPGDLLQETPLRQELVLAVRPHVSAEDNLVRINYYNSLLDLVDHIDEHPHALPASFRSS
jgi:hypothetical protein